MLRFPLATLATCSNGLPEITHLPLIYRPASNGLGSLVGHLDLHNPQAKALNGKAGTVIFHGPSTYISPFTYASEKQLPTYNYIKVHLKGSICLIEDPQLVRESMIEMAEFLETHWGKGFVLSPDNPKMEAYLPFVAAFVFQIESWEGKFKLSQDKTETDQANALEKLAADNTVDHRAYLAEMLKAHKA